MTTSSSHSLCALLFALPLAAQAASGTTHLLVAPESGAGGSAQSLVHRLTGTLSSGVPAARATSAGFVLLGGFPAAIETAVSGTPWLTGVVPAYGPLLGGTALTLHGSELDQGPPQITIGGVAAIAGVPTSATVQTVLPQQLAPGYQPVSVQNAIGSATLPRGIGVLPLIEFPVAHQANVPLGLRYRGAQGDVFVLALSDAVYPFTVPLPPWHHGLQLDLATLFIAGGFFVTDAGGELTIALPAAAPTLPIYFQCLSFTLDPGWSPASFTNVVRL